MERTPTHETCQSRDNGQDGNARLDCRNIDNGGQSVLADSLSRAAEADNRAYVRLVYEHTHDYCDQDAPAYIPRTPSYPPNNCMSFWRSPRACSSLNNAANCSSSNFICADAPQYPARAQARIERLTPNSGCWLRIADALADAALGQS
jgi:hypothetical protein